MLSSVVEYKGGNIEDEVPLEVRLWERIQAMRKDKSDGQTRFLVKEREGRKRVLERDINLTKEELRVLDVVAKGEAYATTNKTSRNKKQASKELGNWRPRLPRKGERAWTKTFSADVAKLKSKRKLMDKIVIFKAFHRELQEETFVYTNQKEQNRGRSDLLDVGEWLLTNLDQSPYADRNLFFGSILFIIKRQEVCLSVAGLHLSPH